MMRSRFLSAILCSLLVAGCWLLVAGTTAHAQEVPVNVMNFVTAQTAMQIDT
jgi:hypothetical protein